MRNMLLKQHLTDQNNYDIHVDLFFDITNKCILPTNIENLNTLPYERKPSHYLDVVASNDIVLLTN